MGDPPRDSRSGPTKAAPKKPAPGRPSAGSSSEPGPSNDATTPSLRPRQGSEATRPSLPDKPPPEVPRRISSAADPHAPAGQPQPPTNYYALLKEKYEQEQAEKRRLLEQEQAEKRRLSEEQQGCDSVEPPLTENTDEAPPPPAEDDPPPPPEVTSFQAIIASHKEKKAKEVKEAKPHLRLPSDDVVPPPPALVEPVIVYEIEPPIKPWKKSANDDLPIYRDLERGELIVKIFKGRDLKARKSLCKVRLENNENVKFETRVLEGNNPGFLQEFVISKQEWTFSSRMHIEVWDMGMIKSCIASLPFEWPPFNPGYTKATFPLLQKGKNVGNLDVCVIDTAICSSKGQIEALNANSALYGLDQYDAKGLLGEGGGGIVRMIVRKIDQVRFAVKVISKKNEADSRSEIEIMSMINHPHCIKLTEMIEMKSNLYLIMPYMSGGSLGERQQARNSHFFSEKETRRYMLEIASGLVYLHSQGIVHRDIKPDNIMFSGPEKSASIKICDFGLATYKKQIMDEGCGTAPYLAPEIVRQESYGKEVDLWALGVVFYFMLCGRLPFHQTNQKLLFHAIRSHDYKMPADISGEAKHLIRCLMEPDPQKRLTAEEVLTHPFVLGVSIDAFVERRPEANEVAVPTALSESNNVVPKARALFDDDEDYDDAVSLFKKAKAASSGKPMPQKAAPRVRATSPRNKSPLSPRMAPSRTESPPPLPVDLSGDVDPPPPPPED